MTARGGVAGAIEAVRERIVRAAERCSRDPAGVRLVAITKGVEPERIRVAIDSGVRDLGENRVQEALAKQREVAPGPRWHLVGHLQTNKASRAASAFHTVHSVDGERVAGALDRHRDVAADPLAVLLEVELTGIGGRHGVAPAQLAALTAFVARCPRLRSIGLMTIAAPGADQARPCFARLRRLRDDLEQAVQLALPELSMGMSGDFEVAIEEGATMVRVGRAIFGEPRPGSRPD